MTDGVPGNKSLTDGLNRFNVLSFITSQLISGLATAQLVLVKSVTPGSGLLAGTVDVQPMVNQIGGSGIAVAHGTIYKLPFFRLQGGKNALIADPVKGDIGVAVFAMRDISSVKANKKVSNPGSARQYSYSDGLYLGGYLNGEPTQYVQFVNDGDGNPTGINVTDANGNTIVTDSDGVTITDLNGNIIKMQSGKIAITGDVEITGTLKSSDTTGLAGGAKKVVLDGDAVVGGHVVASSTKTTAT